MVFFHKYIRYLVIFFNIGLSLFIYFSVSRDYKIVDLRNIRLAQDYALTAILFLYLSLLISPIYIVFPTLPLRGLYTKARRALGVSAFYFAYLHIYFAFFKLLGGFEGLGFLNSKYLVSIFLGFTGSLILFLMATISTNWALMKLGKNWKFIHRFVYLAGTLIVFHALMLGSHFQNLSDSIPTLFFFMLIFLLVLESIRIDKYISKKYSKLRIVVDFLSGIVLTIIIIYFFANGSLLSVHNH
jgi:DMSO/TMAO reductase YedYZ heme-binding membrane subunit